MVKVKNKKNSNSDTLRAKKNINKKKVLNPFEVHVNKEKFQVLGRKNKNDKGLPGVARAKALRKRKNTLGQEYLVKNKSNKFVDRRIGERNSAMTIEDRVTARFTAERVKQHTNKKNIYNLADDEVLTHRGQTLEEIEKFEDPRSDDEYSDDEHSRPGAGRLEDKFVADAHFGGGLFRNTNEEGVKSRKDLIEQLIIESKKRKVEKQKVREATIEMTEKLDTDWKDLLPLVNKSKKDVESEPKTKADDYDIVMRELKFEARGTPSDRLKSEDEVAKQEKEKLEQLENDRLARMHGISEEYNKKNKHRSADDLDDGFDLDAETDYVLSYDDDGKPMVNAGDSDADAATGDTSISNGKNEAKGDLHQSRNEKEDADEAASDNEDDEETSDNEDDDKDVYSDFKSDTSESEEDIELSKKQSKINSEEIKGKLIFSSSSNVLKISKTIDKNSENLLKKRKLSEPEILIDNPRINRESEKEKLVKKEVGKGVLVISSPPEKIILKQREHKKELKKNSNENLTLNIRNDLSERKIIMEKAAKELPFTFKMPERSEELEELLVVQPPDYQTVILERIIKCSHPSLAQGNKEKLEMLMAYLMQYINDRFTDVDTTDELQNSFKILDRVTPCLYDLCQINSQNAYTCFIEVIKEKQADFRKKNKKYPGLETLVFFKLVSLLFPTSDFRHQVVTPSIVFISQILTKCKVRTNVDISYGLFLVTLALEYGVLTKRFLPAAVNFLCGILHMAIPKNFVRLIQIISPFKTIGDFSSLLVLTEKVTTLPKSCDLILTASDFIQNTIDDSFKIRSLYTAINLLKECFDYLKNTPSCQVLFEPHLHMLEMIPLDNYPDKIKKQFQITLKEIESCKDIKIDNIQLEKKRPKALRLYEPSIQKIFDGKRHKVMSREKAEHEKLVHKYKREMKGAMREIRKDKSYIGNLQIRKQIQSDNERRAKVKQIYSEASMQQGELNALSRSKN